VVVSLAAALAVQSAVQATDSQLAPDLKWPNDLLIDGKKFCGILTEMNAEATRVRHIVLRPSAQLGIDAVERRILDFRQQIATGAKTFEEIARQYSEDGSAQSGGDLGWASPGSFVPEFEEAMDKLPISGLSGPVRSRFGVHLIQVLDRRDTTVDPKALREQATNALKEKKFEPAYAEWVADLRAKAFIEYRDAPV